MSRDHEHEDRRLLNWVRTTLDRATEELDPATLARLRAARRQALAQRRTAVAAAAVRQPSRRPRRFVMTAGALAAAAATVLLAVGVGLWFGPLRPGNGSLGLEDIELLAARENPEFFADLEFYRWLAEGDHAG